MQIRLEFIMTASCPNKRILLLSFHSPQALPFENCRGAKFYSSNSDGLGRNLGDNFFTLMVNRLKG
jgi:hypothetical protein